MSRFFCDNIADNKIYIEGEDAKHISLALRMKLGDKLEVSDLNGTDYLCEIESITSKTVELRIISKHKNETEPNVKLTLYQALPKGDKLEFIIQKAVELGVTTIVPVLTKRCVSRPDEKSMAKKLIRYNKIAKEAAKQCGRGVIPEVKPMMSFEKATDSLASHKTSVLFYEMGGERINSLIKKDDADIGIMIGSEGGFDESEVALTVAKGVKTATLGKRILRCETAPLSAVSIIMNITENI